MSTAGDILTQIESDVATLLPGANRLKYVYEIEKNDSGIDNSYGVGIANATTFSGVMKSINQEHNFFVVLTRKFNNNNNDEGLQASIKAIYEDKETLDKNFYQKKLNLGSTVLAVQEVETSEPEFISDCHVAIRTTYLVKYRYRLAT